jgi:glutathione peroxidase
MKYFSCLALILTLTFSGKLTAMECSELLNFNFRTLNDSQQVNLCDEYQGRVLLVVNTASKCAFTDQYDSLEKLYSKYRKQGLVVLGFPSNDFGQQEPGNEKQIKDFCRLTYGVEFPMFAKTHVSQHNAHPFYRKPAEASGGYPQWNFHKYLINTDGKLVAYYQSAVDPLDQQVVKTIETELKRVRF